MSFIGRYSPPGDKSITHRILILSAISKGSCKIEYALKADDTMATLNALKAMGVEFDVEENIIVKGVGLKGLKRPKSEIDCKNSATSMRLLAGILVGQDFDSILIGDKSLSKRPMKRIIEPLTLMGANIKSDDNEHPPLFINPSEGLHPIEYELTVPSAQVKSAIMLASLYTGEVSTIFESKESRNHTEMMLDYFYSNDFKVDEYTVPGDFSSAAFFIAGARLSKGSELLVENVGLNPTRIGLLEVLQRMNANIDVQDIKLKNNELVGNLLIKHSSLDGTEVYSEEIPTMIDEIPMLAILAAFANGETIIRDLGELRAKETDRLQAIFSALDALGVDVRIEEDDLYIKGGKINPAILNAEGDHRLEMAFEILKAVSKVDIEIRGGNVSSVSYPDFYKDFNKIWRTK